MASQLELRFGDAQEETPEVQQIDAEAPVDGKKLDAAVASGKIPKWLVDAARKNWSDPDDNPWNKWELINSQFEYLLELGAICNSNKKISTLFAAEEAHAAKRRAAEKSQTTRGNVAKALKKPR